MAEINHFEHVVTDKLNKSRKWQKALAILGYIFVDAALFWLLFRINPFLIALLALTTWIMVFFTWRYLNVEYEYSIDSGILTFTKIYGNRKRKEFFSVKLKDISKIAPLEDPYIAEAETYAPEKSYYGVPVLDMNDVFYALFDDEDKKRSVFYFQMTTAALKHFKFYCSSAFPAAMHYSFQSPD
ncbi:MAG: hypothetical protein II710_06760 [Clostridia bacterium]|nr:hypothetical protein [Clostridia bacterium]